MNRGRLRNSLADPFRHYWQISAFTADIVISCCTPKLSELHHKHKVENEEMQMLHQLSFSCAHFRFFRSCFHTHFNHLDPTWDVICLLLKHIFSRAVSKDKIPMSLEASTIPQRPKPHFNEFVEEGLVCFRLKIY